MKDYAEFLKAKSQLDTGDGFVPKLLPIFLFDFQRALVDWSIRCGRSAIFADCGLGKTPMQLVWAENVIIETNKPVLILAPLAVSMQTVDEATKFQIDAVRCMDGKIKGKKVHVTNYEKLHYFDPADWGGVVCDESSIIKNFDGSRKGEITAFMRKAKYRLLCTATAAPNDYIELGTSSEALGYLGYMDMLSMFFKNDEDSLHPAFIGSKWRFKRHAESHFWRWMASWSRALRKPSDFGFDDRHFVLPELDEIDHCVESPIPEGCFFGKPAKTLQEQLEDTKATTADRCERAVSILSAAPNGIAWCNTNIEADTIEKNLPGAVQVSGSDSDDEKEEAFTAFRRGEIKHLVTKPKIAAFGMNWQHCNTMTYFTTHSYEQYYQAVRRCWRFGQKNKVSVNMITTSAQSGVLQNMKRKSVACDEMFEQIVDNMKNALHISRSNAFNKPATLPNWM